MKQGWDVWAVTWRAGGRFNAPSDVSFSEGERQGASAKEQPWQWWPHIRASACPLEDNLGLSFTLPWEGFTLQRQRLVAWIWSPGLWQLPFVVVSYLE